MTNPRLPVVLIGGGGHGRVLLDAMRLAGQPILAIADPSPSVARHFADDLPVWDDDSHIFRADPSSVALVNGVGALPGAASRRRRALYDPWVAAGYRFASVVHPAAVVSAGADCACGVQIMAGAVVQTGCRLDFGVVVNTRASIDHDCHLADHVMVSPGAVLCGGVLVGAGAYLGAGCCILQGVSIGSGALIGAGVVVQTSVPAGAVLGPARTTAPEPEASVFQGQ